MGGREQPLTDTRALRGVQVYTSIKGDGGGDP